MKKVTVKLFGQTFKMKVYADDPPTCGYCTGGLFQYLKHKRSVPYIFVARCNCDLGMNYKYNEMRNGEILTVVPKYPMLDPTRSELYDHKNFPQVGDKEDDRIEREERLAMQEENHITSG